MDFSQLSDDQLDAAIKERVSQMSDDELDAAITRAQALKTPANAMEATQGVGAGIKSELDYQTGLPDFGARTGLGFLKSNRQEPAKDEQINYLKRLGYKDVARYPTGELVYRNPKTGKMTAVDESLLTLRDVGDVMGESPEVIGGGGGELAGWLLGKSPTAAAVGAAIGGGFGHVVKEGIGRSLAPERPPVSGKEALLGTGLAAGAQAAGSLIGHGISKAFAPLKEQMVVAAREAAERIGKYGGKLTAAQQTGSRGVQFLENAVQGSLLGGGKVSAQKVANVEAGQAWVDAVVKGADPGKTLMMLGGDIQDAIGVTRELKEEAVKAAYAAVDELAPGVTVNIKNLKKFAAEVLRKENIKIKSGTHHQKTIDVMTKILENPDEIPFEEAVIHRSGLLAAGRKNLAAPQEQVGVAKKMAALLNRDIEASGKGLTGSAAAAHRNASTLYNTHIKEFYNKLIKRVTEADPEKVVDLFLKSHAKRGPAPSAVKRILSTVDESTKNDIRGYYLTRILTEEAYNPSTGLTSGTKLDRFLRQVQPEVRQDLISTTNWLRLHKMANALERVQTEVKGVGGSMMIQLSQAGAIMRGAQLPIGLALGGTGYMTDNPAAWIGAGTVLLGPKVLSKILTSDKGIKWLTEGLLTPADTPGAKQLMVRFGRKISNLILKYGMTEAKDWLSDIVVPSTTEISTGGSVPPVRQ